MPHLIDLIIFFVLDLKKDLTAHRSGTYRRYYFTEKGCNKTIIQTSRRGRHITWLGVTGSRGMISRDGGWVSVMPSDGKAMCFMYHVRWVKRRMSTGEGWEDGSLKRERKQRTMSPHNVTESIRFESRCRFRNTPRALHIYPQEECDVLREEQER